MNNVLQHLSHHHFISTKNPPFPALWFTHCRDCHSWAGLDPQDPPKRGKTIPMGICTGYISMHLEIPDSMGSSGLLKVFSHRPQRCPWPWRFLRRGCPDSALPRCARKGQVPPGGAVEHCLGGALVTLRCEEEIGPTGRHWRGSGPWCSSWLLLATSENVPGLQTWHH